jgi:hypothetical protein
MGTVDRVTGDIDMRPRASLLGTVAVMLMFYVAIIAMGALVIALLPGDDPTRYCLGCEAGFLSPQTTAVLAAMFIGAPALVVAWVGSALAVRPMRRRYRNAWAAGMGAGGVGASFGLLFVAALAIVALVGH